jgi:hypothetical protein
MLGAARACRRGSLPVSRLVCTPRLKGTDAGDAARTKAAAAAAAAIKQAPEFGTNVAAEDSAAQLMHDAQRGKFQYVSDFASSLNTGPVKLSFKDAPKTQEDEAQERALSMIQRSVLVGSLAVLASGVIGWQITKWYMGVNNAKEFSERMNEKMPKVSAEVNTSILGQKLHGVNQESRDKISEDPELTAWRRSLRDKFNNAEGAEIARKNSIHMAEVRAQERKVRKVATATPASNGEVDAAAEAALAAVAVASVAAEAAPEVASVAAVSPAPEATPVAKPQ